MLNLIAHLGDEEVPVDAEIGEGKEAPAEKNVWLRSSSTLSLATAEVSVPGKPDQANGLGEGRGERLYYTASKGFLGISAGDAMHHREHNNSHIAVLTSSFRLESKYTAAPPGDNMDMGESKDEKDAPSKPDPVANTMRLENGLKLKAPSGAGIDGSTVYVADSGNHRIINTVTSTVIAGNGGPGTTLDALNFPSSVTFAEHSVDAKHTKALRYAYVVDAGNHRVIRFPINVKSKPGEYPRGQVVVGRTDKAGSGKYQLDNPKGAAFDKDGNLFVADTNNNRIMKYTAKSVQQAAVDPATGMAMGEMVTALRSLKNPNSVMFDNDGNMYVSDAGNNRVVKWRKAHLRANGKGTGVSMGEVVADIKGPSGIAFDGENNMFVSSYSGNQVLKWESGEIRSKVGSNRTEAAVQGNRVSGTAKSGTDKQSLFNPSGVVFTRVGDLIVVDKTNNRLQDFREMGRPEGCIPPQLHYPHQVLWRGSEKLETYGGPRSKLRFGDKVKLGCDAGFQDFPEPELERLLWHKKKHAKKAEHNVAIPIGETKRDEDSKCGTHQFDRTMFHTRVVPAIKAAKLRCFKTPACSGINQAELICSQKGPQSMAPSTGNGVLELTSARASTLPSQFALVQAASFMGSSRSGGKNCGRPKLGGRGAWCFESAQTNPLKHMLELDLGETMLVGGIVTSGLRGRKKFVTQLSVSMSVDKTIWENTNPVEANKDDRGEVQSVLSKSVRARYVRVHVLKWSEGGAAIRVGVLASPAGIPSTSLMLGESKPKREMALDVTMQSFDGFDTYKAPRSLDDTDVTELGALDTSLDHSRDLGEGASVVKTKRKAYKELRLYQADTNMQVAMSDKGDVYWINGRSNNLMRWKNKKVATAMKQATSLRSAKEVWGQSEGITLLQTFQRARDVAFDASGFMYIADTGYRRILKISVSAFGRNNSDATVVAGGAPNLKDGVSTLDEPSSVAFDSEGNMYVADKCRIVRWFRHELIMNKNHSNGAYPGQTVAGGSCGSGLNQLQDVSRLAISTAGDLYAADTGNNRIMRYETPDLLPGVNPKNPTTSAGLKKVTLGEGKNFIRVNGKLQVSPTANLTNMMDKAAQRRRARPVINGTVKSPPSLKVSQPSRVKVGSTKPGQIVAGGRHGAIARSLDRPTVVTFDEYDKMYVGDVNGIYRWKPEEIELKKDGKVDFVPGEVIADMAADSMQFDAVGNLFVGGKDLTVIMDVGVEYGCKVSTAMLANQGFVDAKTGMAMRPGTFLEEKTKIKIACANGWLTGKAGRTTTCLRGKLRPALNLTDYKCHWCSMQCTTPKLDALPKPEGMEWLSKVSPRQNSYGDCKVKVSAGIAKCNQGAKIFTGNEAISCGCKDAYQAVAVKEQYSRDGTDCSSFFVTSTDGMYREDPQLMQYTKRWLRTCGALRKKELAPNKEFKFKPYVSPEGTDIPLKSVNGVFKKAGGERMFIPSIGAPKTGLTWGKTKTVTSDAICRSRQVSNVAWCSTWAKWQENLPELSRGKYRCGCSTAYQTQKKNMITSRADQSVSAAVQKCDADFQANLKDTISQVEMEAYSWFKVCLEGESKAKASMLGESKTKTKKSSKKAAKKAAKKKKAKVGDIKIQAKGCYKDCVGFIDGIAVKAIVLKKKLGVKNTTPEKCGKLCADQSYIVFGLTKDHECWCSDNLKEATKFGPAAKGTCNCNDPKRVGTCVNCVYTVSKVSDGSLKNNEKNLKHRRSKLDKSEKAMKETKKHHDTREKFVKRTKEIKVKEVPAVLPRGFEWAPIPSDTYTFWGKRKTWPQKKTYTKSSHKGIDGKCSSTFWYGVAYCILGTKKVSDVLVGSAGDSPMKLNLGYGCAGGERVKIVVKGVSEPSAECSRFFLQSEAKLQKQVVTLVKTEHQAVSMFKAYYGVLGMIDRVHMAAPEGMRLVSAPMKYVVRNRNCEVRGSIQLSVCNKQPFIQIPRLRGKLQPLTTQNVGCGCRPQLVDAQLYTSVTWMRSGLLAAQVACGQFEEAILAEVRRLTSGELFVPKLVNETYAQDMYELSTFQLRRAGSDMINECEAMDGALWTDEARKGNAERVKKAISGRNNAFEHQESVHKKTMSDKWKMERESKVTAWDGEKAEKSKLWAQEKLNKAQLKEKADAMKAEHAQAVELKVKKTTKADQARSKALHAARLNAITSKQRELAEKKEDLANQQGAKDERKNKDAYTKTQKDMVNEQRDKYKVTVRSKKAKMAKETSEKDEIKLEDAKGKVMMALKREMNAAGLVQNTMQEKFKLQTVEDTEDPAAAKEAKRKEEARKSEEHELRLIETERERARGRLSKEITSTDTKITKLKENKEKFEKKLGMSSQLAKLKTMVAKYKQKMKHHTTPRMSPLVPGVQF